MKFKEKLAEAYDNYNIPEIRKGILVKSIPDSKLILTESANNIIPYSTFQQILRPLFGKSDYNEICIGDHPDFTYLKGTDNKEYHQITTMFVDIAGSTRLNLFYNPEEVQVIKNTFICAAIDIVKAFDGHVHRIMGDAIMVFFGGKKTSSENGIIDAINCASIIRYFTDRIVIPKLDKLGYEDPFGIRIGLDYGKKEDVLWSSYGYPGISEVTATSFYVDIASKLQNTGSKNDIMIGDSLKNYIDLPNTILKTRYKNVNGVNVADYYIKPNYIGKDGKPINYKKYILDWKEYLKFTNVGIQDKEFFYTSTTALNIEIEVFDSLDKNYEGMYKPSSFALKKLKQIRFHVNVPYLPRLPYKLKFSVQNHGAESEKILNNGNHHSFSTISTEREHRAGVYHNEYTAYRGLQYLIIEVIPNGGKALSETCIGVFIE